MPALPPSLAPRLRLDTGDACDASAGGSCSEDVGCDDGDICDAAADSEVVATLGLARGFRDGAGGTGCGACASTGGSWLSAMETSSCCESGFGSEGWEGDLSGEPMLTAADSTSVLINVPFLGFYCWGKDNYILSCCIIFLGLKQSLKVCLAKVWKLFEMPLLSFFDISRKVCCSMTKLSASLWKQPTKGNPNLNE